MISGQSHGIHAFLVRIRDDELNVMPNVRVEDMGHKMGLNGVDNAKLLFDNVRIPRENLLNRWEVFSVNNCSRCFVEMLFQELFPKRELTEKTKFQIDHCHYECFSKYDRIDLELEVFFWFFIKKKANYSRHCIQILGFAYACDYL